MRLQARLFVVVISFVCVLPAMGQDAVATSNKMIEESGCALKEGIGASVKGFYYEQPISSNKHFNFAFHVLAGNSLPVKNLFIHTAGQNDPGLVRTIENLRLRHSSVTLELRCYPFKKGLAKGIYIAPFYRHACFRTHELNIDYSEDKTGQQGVRLNGKLTTNTVGLFVGAKMTVNKNLILNWWIMGPHVGSGRGFLRTSNELKLNQQQQQNIKDELNNLDLLQIKKKVDVSSSCASLQLNGQWSGLKAGVYLSFKNW